MNMHSKMVMEFAKVVTATSCKTTPARVRYQVFRESLSTNGRVSMVHEGHVTDGGSRASSTATQLACVTAAATIMLLMRVDIWRWSLPLHAGKTTETSSASGRWLSPGRSYWSLQSPVRKQSHPNSSGLVSFGLTRLAVSSLHASLTVC